MRYNFIIYLHTSKTSPYVAGDLYLLSFVIYGADKLVPTPSSAPEANSELSWPRHHYLYLAKALAPSKTTSTLSSFEEATFIEE